MAEAKSHPDIPILVGGSERYNEPVRTTGHEFSRSFGEWSAKEASRMAAADERFHRYGEGVYPEAKHFPRTEAKLAEMKRLQANAPGSNLVQGDYRPSPKKTIGTPMDPGTIPDLPKL
ncbi:MAG: hypothetical protein ABSF77_06480 [Spirochaetia bacterium]|jgi:hypothetical protein